VRLHLRRVLYYFVSIECGMARFASLSFAILNF